MELALAAAHTSGYNPVMAFHAGAVHAQDRGLEAVAWPWPSRPWLPCPGSLAQAAGGDHAVDIGKTFTPVPLGISLVVANSVFPTWNSYPGLFASLATGNPVLVKPHPAAVLPLALTVRLARETLADAGFSPDLVCLAVERPRRGRGPHPGLTPRDPPHRLLRHHRVRHVAGRARRQARVFTAGSAVNTVVVHSTGDYRDMLANLAFSVSLYSGQLCTSPQNLLIPEPASPPTRAARASSRSSPTSARHSAPSFPTTTRPPPCSARSSAPPSASEWTSRRAEGSAGSPFRPAPYTTPTIPRQTSARRWSSHSTRPARPTGPLCSPNGSAPLLRRRRGLGGRGARPARPHHPGVRGPSPPGLYSTDREVERAMAAVCADVGVMLSVNLAGDWYISQSAVYPTCTPPVSIRPATRSTATPPSWPDGSGRWSTPVRRCGVSTALAQGTPAARTGPRTGTHTEVLSMAGAPAAPLLAIEGMPGIGKTRLLQEAALLAERLGYDINPTRPKGGYARCPRTSGPRLVILDGAGPLPATAPAPRSRADGSAPRGAASGLSAAATPVPRRRPAATATAPVRCGCSPTGPGGMAAPAAALLGDEPRGRSERLTLGALGASRTHRGSPRTCSVPTPRPALERLVDQAGRASAPPHRPPLAGLREEGGVRIAAGEAELLSRRLPERLELRARTTLERYSGSCRQFPVCGGPSLGDEVVYEELALMMRTSVAALLPVLEEVRATGAIRDRAAGPSSTPCCAAPLADSVPDTVRGPGAGGPVPAHGTGREAPAEDGTRPSRARTRRSAPGSPRPSRRWSGLVADGLTNQQIGRRLALSPHTVNYHLRKLFQRYGVSSRIDLLQAVTGAR